MTGRYRVGTAAKLAGLSPHTLRVWERRYGPFATLRSPGGNRLYGDADVQRVALLKRLVDEGHAIGSVASLRTSELSRIATRYHGTDALPAAKVVGAARQPLVHAARRMETQLLDELFARAALALTPRELIEGVVSPLFEEVGRDWEEGRLDVAHEHAVTAVVRNQLGALLRSYRPSATARTVVVTTPEGELHELGALGAGLVAAGAGYRVEYLGPSVPAKDVAAAAGACRAMAVLVSCITPVGRRMRAIEKVLPPGVRLFAGGPSAPEPLKLRELERALRRSAGT